jgi:AbiU2
MKEIKIETAEELTKLLDALAKEIVDANIYHRLLFDLMDSQESNKPVFRNSNTFWSLTFDSLQDAMMIRLCRVYDQHSSSLNLANLLLTIQSNLDLFQENHFRDRLQSNAFIDSLTEVNRVPSEKDLKADIKYVSNENPLVDKLTVWRGNIIAHRGAKVVLGKTRILDEKPLSWSEIEDLLDKGFEIYNRYSSLYRASTYSRQIMGHDDYKSLLKFANLGLDKYKHDIEMEHSQLLGDG